MAAKYNNNKVFDTMLESASPDKTMVDLFGPKPTGPTSKDVHNTLMAAGFAPAYGNLADAADALLYIAEGEFGEAALSFASAIPLAGQYVASKRAIKAAKEAGEEFVTLYKPYNKWEPGKMVKEGKFIGRENIEPIRRTTRHGGEFSIKDPFFTTTNKSKAIEEVTDIYSGKRTGPVLEFNVPESWLYEHGISSGGRKITPRDLHGIPSGHGNPVSSVWFKGGLEKDFLTKVIK